MLLQITCLGYVYVHIHQPSSLINEEDGPSVTFRSTDLTDGLWEEERGVEQAAGELIPPENYLHLFFVRICFRQIHTDENIFGKLRGTPTFRISVRLSLATERCHLFSGKFCN